MTALSAALLLLLFALVPACTSAASQAIVDNENALRSALENHRINDILISHGFFLTNDCWPADSPVKVLRNVTLRGRSNVGEPRLTLHFNFILNAVQLGSGVMFTLEDLFVTGLRQEPFLQRPGMNFFAMSPPGPPSVLQWHSITVDFFSCR